MSGLCNSPLSRLPMHAWSHADSCCACTRAPVVRMAELIGALLLRYPVATQGLPALTTPCRVTSHNRDIGLEGLCCDKENLCRNPSHPVPALNPFVTQKFYRDTGPRNLCHDREFSVVTEEPWAVCRDRDFLS